MVARTALVFGADHPLGATAALALAARGFGVLLVGTNERALAETVGEIAFGGGRARHFVDSVEAGEHAARERAREVFGAGEPRMVFAPGWKPREHSGLDVIVLHSAPSSEQALQVPIRDAFGHVFVVSGADDPGKLAAVLAGPTGVHVIA